PFAAAGAAGALSAGALPAGVLPLLSEHADNNKLPIINTVDNKATPFFITTSPISIKFSFSQNIRKLNLV
ncbi:hypothetical protein K0U00_05405, partial [Paenibacillus sepulcri]|nr:hypothetical protein [Paenibacillus sepulcri]